MINIVANNDGMITNSVYKYIVIDNVINYSYEDVSVWRVDTDTGSNCKSDSDTNYYLIIDTHGHEAFAHWVFESAIYLPLFTKLKQKYSNIKLHLKCVKGYKSLFCDYFNINRDDITTTIEINNKCFFPNPITALIHKTISDEYITLVKEFSSYFTPFCGETIQTETSPLHIYADEVNHLNETKCKRDDVNKTIDIAFLPRQTKENYVNNDRYYNTCDIEDKIKDNINNVILRTDNITKLDEQINIIKSSKNIILTGGSPYLVNGIFSKNANIICLDSIVEGHAQGFPKIKHIHEMILKENRVTMIPNYQTFCYSSIEEYLTV